MDSLHYTRALVISDVPESLPANAQRLDEPSDPVNLEQARQQLRDYKSALESLGLQLIEIPVDENYPDCVFVEDPVIICGKKALLPRMGHSSRKGEVDAVRKVLERLGSYELHEMHEPACLDGGDVLFTGRELFVGLSSRTNEEGVECLAKTFTEYPVTPVKVVDELHLKSMLTMLGQDTIIIANNKAGKLAWEDIKNKGKFEYTKVEVPDVRAANVLYINGKVVHQPIHCPDTKSVIEENKSPKVIVDASEFTKVDGCLTCLSVLM